MSAAANIVPIRPERIKLDCPPHLYAPVLLTPGEYEIAYVSHHAARQFRRGVLTVYFVVADMLPEIIVVSRYYPIRVNVRKDPTTGKKRTSWQAPKNGALVADFRQIFTRHLGRLDRFPISWLADQRVIGELGTVTRNYKQTDLDHAAYSVVRRLVRTC